MGADFVAVEDEGFGVGLGIVGASIAAGEAGSSSGKMRVVGGALESSRRSRRTARVGRSGAALSGLIALAGFAIAAPASAHTAGIPVPPEGDYLIRWHQPHSKRPIDDWEIEVTPSGDPTRRFIATAQVFPDPSCWALNVPVAEPAIVRVRAVDGTQVSAWTRQTVVPEPVAGAGLAAGSALLALLARRRVADSVIPRD